ncbi:hypothetical protein [Noviherbaspirillum sedimenti]
MFKIQRLAVGAVCQTLDTQQRRSRLYFTGGGQWGKFSIEPVMTGYER